MTQKFAVLIPTWRRPKAMIRLFRKCPALNTPHTYVGVDQDGAELYEEWRHKYATKVTVIPIANPQHYCSDAQMQIQYAVPLGQYDRVIFSDDNAVFTSEALHCLNYAHSLFPTDIMNGTNNLGHFFHKEDMQKARKFAVPSTLQPYTGCKTISIFDQQNSTFWAVPAVLYRKFHYTKGNYHWDAELTLWSVLEGDVTRVLGCVEAVFAKHRHDFKENKQSPARKLEQIGESMSILARRFPEVAHPGWMSPKIPVRALLKERNAR